MRPNHASRSNLSHRRLFGPGSCNNPNNRIANLFSEIWRFSRHRRVRMKKYCSDTCKIVQLRDVQPLQLNISSHFWRFQMATQLLNPSHVPFACEANAASAGCCTDPIRPRLSCSADEASQLRKSNRHSPPESGSESLLTLILTLTLVQSFFWTLNCSMNE